MRSFLLVFSALLLVICGFVIYWQVQTPPASRQGKQGTARGPASMPADGGGGSTSRPLVGAGSDAWVRQFDEKTAQLKSQFKAARYEPQPDGTVNVDKPVGEFMLGGGRFVRIEGARGKVIMPPQSVPQGGSDPAVAAASPAAPPNRGQLHDVVISLFDEAAPEGQAPVPSLTVEMNNAAFDNDTFLIATEAFTDAGNNVVAADQVPVKVRGRDYDFDGRGLRIQWNALSQRLQLLEIAHGESLTIKNRETIGALEGGETSATTAPSPAAAQKKQRGAGPTADGAPLAATSPTTRPVVPYRASFEKDLRITEGDAEVASGSLMQIDFVIDPEQRAAESGDAPGQQSPARGTKRRPASAPAEGEAETSPATQPAPPAPLVVRWSGRLRVMPVEQSDGPPLGPREQIIRLAGTPLKLRRDGSDVEAAAATFHTGDGSASVRSGDEVPRVTLRDAKGAVITTPALAYSERGALATLTGPSAAEIPIGDGDGGLRETLSATWSEEAKLALPQDEHGQAVIRSANIKGSVAIAHPRIDLNSDALDLTFAAPTTRPAPAQDDASPTTQPADTPPSLERLIATGSVQAKLKDPAAPATQPRTVHAGRLEMQTLVTADGQLLPRTIIADEDVLMAEQSQSLRAQHVEAALAARATTMPTTFPSDRPSTASTTRGSREMPEMIVESLVAQGKVRLDGQRGAYATAEQLAAVVRDGQSEVKLQGLPEAAAVVSDGKNTITGGVLTLRPKEQKAEVPGAGTLSFTPVGEDGQPQPPVKAAWTGYAALNGNTNLVDVHEGVAFETIGDDGTTTTSRSNHLQVVLVDKPATQPATQPTTEPSTQPNTRARNGGGGSASGGGGLGDLQDMSFLDNKDPRSAKLTGEVRIESTLLGAEGAVLRRMYLRADEANYDLPSRLMVVPVSGGLLYEDHRPPTTQPAGGDERATGDDSGAANRGTTAFEWKRSLTYDDARRRVEMAGDVDINHVPDAQGGEQFRIATQRVVAELEPKPTIAPTTEPTTKPTSRPAGMGGLRLKQVTADGGVHVTTRRFQFTATEVAYNPVTAILTARSSPGNPIRLTDDQGEQSTIESLTWNTKTDQTSIKGGRGRFRP
jgi:hypothetical protein